MSYQYTFHYVNGRRAVMDSYEISSDLEAVKCARNIAKKKGRQIKVFAHTYRWYNDMNREVGIAYPDGKIIVW